MLNKGYKDIVDEIAGEAIRHVLALFKTDRFKATINNMELAIKSCGGELVDEVSGGARYVSKSDGCFVVYRDSKTVSVRDLAHELGHYFLLKHMYNGNPPEGLEFRNIACSGVPQNNSTVFGDDYKTEYRYEMAVHYFERAFLLPKKDFITAVDRHTDSKKICNTIRIAEMFGAPEHLVMIRGDDLGLWERRAPRPARRKVETEGK